jgi:hypothetical protein
MKRERETLLSLCIAQGDTGEHAVNSAPLALSNCTDRLLSKAGSKQERGQNQPKKEQSRSAEKRVTEKFTPARICQDALNVIYMSGRGRYMYRETKLQEVR